MSLLDKFVAAVTPPESQEARVKAREKARAAASPGDWLSAILEQHLAIEAAFAAVKAAGDAASRRAAQKKLGVVLTGHATAEESVIYPALADVGEVGHADMGYTEQAMVKMQLAALETLDPMSEDFLDKLEHIRGAVTHHMYEEEGSWLLKLKEKAPSAVQTRITTRYLEEFERYVGEDDDGKRIGGEPRTWDATAPRAQ